MPRTLFLDLVAEQIEQHSPVPGPPRVRRAKRANHIPCVWTTFQSGKRLHRRTRYFYTYTEYHRRKHQQSLFRPWYALLFPFDCIVAVAHVFCLALPLERYRRARTAPAAPAERHVCPILTLLHRRCRKLRPRRPLRPRSRSPPGRARRRCPLPRRRTCACRSCLLRRPVFWSVTANVERSTATHECLLSFSGSCRKHEVSFSANQRSSYLHTRPQGR